MDDESHCDLEICLLDLAWCMIIKFFDLRLAGVINGGMRDFRMLDKHLNRKKAKSINCKCNETDSSWGDPIPIQFVEPSRFSHFGAMTQFSPVLDFTPPTSFSFFQNNFFEWLTLSHKPQLSKFAWISSDLSPCELTILHNTIINLVTYLSSSFKILVIQWINNGNISVQSPMRIY